MSEHQVRNTFAVSSEYVRCGLPFHLLVNKNAVVQLVVVGQTIPFGANPAHIGQQVGCRYVAENQQ